VRETREDSKPPAAPLTPRTSSEVASAVGVASTEPREAERLQLIADLGLHPDDDDAVFDSITTMAGRLGGAATAVVTLVDADSQWFSSGHGLAANRAPRAVTFGNLIIANPDAGVMEVPDALLDVRFVDNPHVTGELGIRFFAGAPIRPLGDHAVGALCLIAHEPRRLSDDDRYQLLELAAIAEQLLRHRLAARRGREAVERTRQSEMRYRYLADNMADMITVHRRDRTLQYVSPSSAVLLGYSADEMMGFGRDRTFVHLDDGDSLIAGAQALTPENPSAHMEARLIRKNGEEVHAAIHTRATFIDGKPHEYHSAIHNNQEVHRYRTGLERTNRQLTELAAERNTLIQAVAHDLSAPLAAIRLTAELIATQVEPAIAAQTNQLRDLARDAESMVSDLLRVTQPGSATIKLTTTATDISAVVSHSLVQVAASNPLSLDVDSFDGLVDPNALSRVLVNVIGNAVRYTPAGTPICVNAHRDGGLAVITVSDEGPGIPAEDRDRLVQPYQRGSDANVPGSGLGLAIARALTESHGGQMVLGENDPHGLVVTITLPIAAEPPRDE
jgi:PAS domain S-box-containing protein